MRLGGDAAYLTVIHSEEDIIEAAKWADEKDLPLIMIGEGSNIVWRDKGFNGLLAVNRIKGFEKLSEDLVSVTYRIGAGEDWDGVVGKLVGLGLSGVESLSLIPGTTGATPVQNVGAYGQEISQTLQRVDAYDCKDKKIIVIDIKDCGFSYRDSRFKTADKGRFLITFITLRLLKSVPKPPFYQTLQTYLDEHHIIHYDSPTIREAVIAIRSAKMPDWHKVANNGSFFANPIVDQKTYERIKSEFPEVVAWGYEGGYKLGAGWLVESCGLRGYKDEETGMATWDKQALVIVNEHAKSTADLLKFKQKIVDKVHEKFGITLQQEPELLP